MDNFIVVNKNNQVICLGNHVACKGYISQLYNESEDSLDFIHYDKDHFMYDDYNLYRIKTKNANIYLTKGEISLMENSCRDEQSSVKLIEDELIKLIETNNIFSYETIDEMKRMLEFIPVIKREHAKYLSNSLFDNLDLDGLNSAYRMERENKGLPTVYYKNI